MKGRALIDLTGQKFGRLYVVDRYDTPDMKSRPLWRCFCDCGRVAIVEGQNLRAGMTRSCGCLRTEVLRENAKRRKEKNRERNNNLADDKRGPVLP